MAILGIDLGTTNSLVGCVDSGFPILLADEQDERLLPSAVHYPKSGSEPAVGAPALRQLILEPMRTVTSGKRLIGRRRGEIDETRIAYPLVGEPGQMIRIDIPLENETSQTPEQVSALILRQLRSRAEKALDEACDQAVITVPAYFNDAQRQATKRAGELAGLRVARILNEPTAAALAFGLHRSHEHAKIAVYDLGGGTFDISVLEIRDGAFPSPFHEW